MRRDSEIEVRKQNSPQEAAGEDCGFPSPKIRSWDTHSFYPAYIDISKILNLIQHYKFAPNMIVVAIAVVWAGGISVSSARRQEESNSWLRKLKQAWLEGVLDLIYFFGLVLSLFFMEVWKLLRETVRHLWQAISSCVRVFLLIIVTWVIATVLHELAAQISVLWNTDTLWLDSWHPLWSTAGYILLSWPHVG